MKSISITLNVVDGSDDARALADCLGGYEGFRLLQIRAVLDSGLMAFESASAFMEWLSEDALGRFRLIDASDAASLGRYWAEEAPDAIPEDMTPEEYAKKCMSEEDGMFTAFGYIYRREREPGTELAAPAPVVAEQPAQDGEPAPEITAETAHESAKTKPLIRFVNSHYAELFSIPDSSNIRVTYPPGDGRGAVVLPCEYVNDCHMKVGGEVYSIYT